MKKGTKQILLFLLYVLVGFVYAPVWCVGYLLHILGRLILSIAYLLMGQWLKAKYTFKSLFKYE